jgi:hypothetical protein
MLVRLEAKAAGAAPWFACLRSFYKQGRTHFGTWPKTTAMVDIG